MSVAVSLNEAKGFCRLGWLTRIGFGAGDLAQNLVYQTISIYLLIYYTNVSTALTRRQRRSCFS